MTETTQGKLQAVRERLARINFEALERAISYIPTDDELVAMQERGELPSDEELARG